MDPASAYTMKAEDYANYRPDYAPEAFDALADLTGMNPDWVVADIGSGTGNVAKHLVGRVQRIYAVEPNEAMRRQAERSLGGQPAFRSIAASAEATTLPDRSVDLITVGQALHWFNPDAAKREFSRILKPGGWLAAVWNSFGGPEERSYSAYLPADAVIRHSYPMSFLEDWEHYIGGARSAAGSPNPGGPGYAAFHDEQRRVFDARAVGGLIAVKYSTELAVGRWSTERVS